MEDFTRIPYELVALRLRGAEMMVDTQVVRHGGRWLLPAVRAFLETSRELLSFDRSGAALGSGAVSF